MSGAIDFNDINRRMIGAVSSFKNDIASLRTGRASTNFLDPIKIEVYGSRMSLNQIATITVPEPRMLNIAVWDKSMVLFVERTIRQSQLGLNPIIDGQNLRIPLPELNEERRNSLVKLAHDYAEKAKVAIRHIRRDGMDSLKKAEKEGNIGKDESHFLSDKVQKITDDTISEIDRLLSEKEQRIKQI